MMEPLLWPYDELNIKTYKEEEKLSIELPWLKLSVTLEDGKAAAICQLQEKIKTGKVESADIQNYSRFLQSFRPYPIYYILPQNKNGDGFQEVSKDYLNKSPKDVLKAICETKDENFEGIKSSHLSQAEEVILRDEFLWDFEAAIQFSNFDDQVHPESLLTVARRFYMIDVLNSNEVINIYDKIRDLSDDARPFGVGTMVKQNHYVTQRCQAALEPALISAQSATNKVKNFMNEEKGHDEIMQRSIESLGIEIDSLPISLNTKCLMDLLYYAAKRNFLGFAIIVDFFERSNYTENDPLAQLLIDSGYDKAAKFINRHMHINDSGGHDLMSFELLENVGLCSQDYAREALVLAELTSLFMNNLVRSTYKEYIEKL